MNSLRVLETCLYADDLAAMRPFYEQFLGLEVVDDPLDERHLFFRCDESMLLIFNPRHTAHEQSDVDGQPIPLHGAQGAGHVAFAVSPEEMPGWKERLAGFGVEIESEVVWPNGAVSIYFRDPAGNSVELANPGLWSFAD
ncbi:MAG: VOC family protein [Planctomycetaceae bacterium]|nr:VOC family protein [Planctomycetaceae bacterium]